MARKCRSDILKLAGLLQRLRARGLHPNKITVAITREMAAFIWDIARQIAIPA